MLDGNTRQMLRRDADMLRSTNRNGETSMSRVEAFERLFGHLPELLEDLETAEAESARARQSSLDTARKMFQLGILILRMELNVSRKRASEAEAERDALTTELGHVQDTLTDARGEIDALTEENRELRDERDLLRETLAESDLGAQVLAQWQAIAAADADRDRLEGELDDMEGVVTDLGVVRLQLQAERDALKAAIEKVRYLLERWQQGRGTDTFPAIALRSALAALAVPESTESDSTDQQTTQHTDRYGRTWDAHPFVQNRAVDNVRVCICGQWTGHRIHSPAVPESNEDAEVCGDERPREFGDTRVITCTLPRGHASHRAAKYGSAWEYLRVGDDLATTPDAPKGGEDSDHA